METKPVNVCDVQIEQLRQTAEVKQEQPTWSEQEEEKLRLRLDLRIVPILACLYLLCFLDRTNIGNARIQGLQADLHLHGYQFNWCLTIFYIGYFMIEIPSNTILQIVGARYYLPLTVVAFGLVSLCTAFVKDFKGLMVCRFVLGLTEGGLMPGSAYYLTYFYRRSELLLRISLFANGAVLSGAFGGLLAAGLVQIPGWGTENTPIHTWRNIFFFEGIVTIIIGIVVIFYLPSNPKDCRFLSERDRYIASERMNQEYKETTSQSVTMNDFYRGMCNVNSIICGLLFLFAQVAVQSIGLFMPSILREMGYAPIRAQLHTVPVYAVAVICSIATALLSDRLRKRGIFICAGALVAMTGYTILATVTDHQSTRYGAVFIAAIGIFCIGTTVLAWILNNTAGTAIRGVASAFVVGVGSAGSIIATWSYLPKDAPNYRKGHFINMGAEICVLALGLTGILYARWENQQRKHGKRNHRLQGLDENEAERLGFRHPEFRYTE